MCTHTFWGFYLFLFYVYECFPYMMNVSATHACSTCGDQERASAPLELELRPVVSCHMGATWEVNQCHLEGQPVLLTDEPSLQLPFILFYEPVAIHNLELTVC